GDTLTVDSATVDVDGSGTPVTLVLGTATALTATDGSAIGDLTLNADGSYSFDPAPNFNGTVPQVGYTVTDTEGNTDSTTLDITVTPVEDVPVANPEVETTLEDTELTGNVLTNDTDGDGNNTLTVDSATVDVDGSGTPVTLVLGTATALTATDGSAIGDLTLNADGSYSFDPAPNFNGTVPQVGYTVTDTEGNTDSTTLDITVTPVNDDPVAVDDAYTVVEDGNVILTPLTTGTADSDLDGDTLSISNINGTDLTPGTAQSIAVDNGVVNIDAAGVISFTPNPDFNGTAEFDYTITDGTATATATETITVTPVNDAPVAVDDAYTVVEDGNVILTPLTTGTADSDLDGDTLSISNINGTDLTPGTAQSIAVDNGVVNIDAQGVITFVPDTNFNGQVQFDYTITDGNGGTDTATETITVTAVNDTPVAVDDVGSGPLNQLVSVDILANDTDPENDLDPTTVIITQAPAAGSIIAADGKSVIVPGEGIWSVNSTTGEITFTPTTGFTDDPTPISYTVDDSTGLTSNEATVTIDYPPTAPIAVDDAYSVDEDGTIVIDPLNADSDFDGDTLSITEINGTILTPGTAQTIAVPNGVVTIDTAGVISFTPDANFNGTVEFDYTITDGTETATATETITVTPVDDAPVAVDDAYTVEEDGTVVLAPLTTGIADSDLDGDTLSITDINGTLLTPGTAQTIAVPNGVVNIDNAGVITFTPDANFNGDVEFDYTITDGTSSVSATETITVTPVNDIAANPEVEITPEDTILTDNVLTNDTDEDGTTLAVQSATVDIDGSGTQVALVLGTATAIEDSTGAPIGDLTLNADGSYTFDPALDFNGTVPTVNYVVADPDGNTDSTTLDITVNDAPIVTFSNIAVSEEGLAGGIADSNALAGFTDTTNRAQQTGAIVVTDTDLASVNDLSVTLNGPIGITSQGEPITWTQVGDTLTGTATIDGVVVDVATVTIGAFTDNGGGNYTADYTTTLLQSIDHPNTTGEDSLDLDFTATVSDGIDDSASSAFVISVEDDTPDASSSNADILLQPVNTNLLLIVDVSGSMGTVENGVSRLQATKDALIEAIDKYEEFGDVKVRLVTFSSDGQAIGTEWVSSADAITQINALTAGGVTNYDAALGSAIDAFDDVGKLEPVSIVDSQGNEAFNNPTNKSIFITDGVPNRGLGDTTQLSGTVSTGSADYGIQAAEEVIWTDFLKANSIDSSALSIINFNAGSTAETSLNAIAYDGRNDVDVDGVIVSAATLEQTILDGIDARNATGNLVSAGGSTNTGFGADDGYLSEVDIDGSNYTFNKSTGQLTTAADASTYSYDQSTTTVTITTAAGGSLIVNFSTGNYQYDVPNDATTAYTETLTFSVLDNDGDGVNNTIELNILFPVTTGTAGNDFLLGNNDDNVLDGLDGNDVISGGTGADSLTGGAGNDTLIFQVDNVLMDGGDGTDTLIINNNGIDIDFSTFDSTKFGSIEVIEMTGSGTQTLSNLTTSDVLDIIDETVVLNKGLTINGDSTDTVQLTGTDWNNTNTTVQQDGKDYDVYNFTDVNGSGVHEILIQTDVNII
ncbi:beta strand repeat-containing protein, partial [Psychrobacter fozii]